jgi:hypothetical protein
MARRAVGRRLLQARRHVFPRTSPGAQAGRRQVLQHGQSRVSHLSKSPVVSSRVTCSFMFAVSRPYLRSHRRQPSSRCEDGTFQAFPTHREDQTVGGNRGLLVAGKGSDGRSRADNLRSSGTPYILARSCVRLWHVQGNIDKVGSGIAGVF